MNMIKKITFTWMLVIASLVTTTAVAATQTYEVSIFSLRLPVSENGTITLRACDESLVRREAVQELVLCTTRIGDVGVTRCHYSDRSK